MWISRIFSLFPSPIKIKSIELKLYQLVIRFINEPDSWYGHACLTIYLKPNFGFYYWWRMLDIRIICPKFVPKKTYVGDSELIRSMKSHPANNFVNWRLFITWKCE